MLKACMATGFCLAIISFAVPIEWGANVFGQGHLSNRPLRWDTGQVITEADLERLTAGSPESRVTQGSNIRVNQSAPAAETTILVNPLDPDHLVAAAMDSSSLSVRATPYLSFDRGRTWQQQQPLLNFVNAPGGGSVLFQNQSDPVLTADNQGNVYLSTIMWDTETPDNGVFVFKSTNGGRRFSPGVSVYSHIGEENPPFEDKEWITADTTGGSFNNNLYVSWTSFGPSAPRILFSRSIDQGTSFSHPMAINDDDSQNSSVQGSMPQIGPLGEVYVIWLHYRSGQPDEILFDKSFDGGLTFSVDQTVSSFRGFGRLRALARNGGSLPSLAVDRSQSHTRGNLYVVWADARNGDVDILLSRSADGGRSWSNPLRVNDDAAGNGKDQFMPFVTVDQTNGSVVVGYYDRRDSVENFLVNYRVAWSTDGGVSFEPSLNLTDEPFDPSAAFRFIRAAGFVCSAPFMGDYTSLAAHGGWIYPIWADTRYERADLFTEPLRY